VTRRGAPEAPDFISLFHDVSPIAGPGNRLSGGIVVGIIKQKKSV
jgi:hypothetical protein